MIGFGHLATFFHTIIINKGGPSDKANHSCEKYAIKLLYVIQVVKKDF